MKVHQSMTKPLVRASLAASLDGYIADEGGRVDWLNQFFDGLDLDFGAFVNQFGAVIMGRKTFDHSPMKGGNPYVLTRGAIEGGVGFTDIPATVSEIRRSIDGTGKDIWLMGGGEAISAFLSADSLDTLELTLLPITLGKGVPLFPAGFPSRRLQLAKSKVHPNGAIGISYTCRG